jgi:hypothetical protein
MKVNAKIKSSFVHGNKPYAPGDEGQFTKAEANDLEKSGLIEVGSEVEDEQAETKMAHAPENKMAEAPANKSRQKKAD